MKLMALRGDTKWGSSAVLVGVVAVLTRMWRRTTDVILLPGGKYRWRTRARMNTPWFLLNRFDWLFAKGLGDCGNHEWHNQDGHSEHCLHCVARRPLREEWKSPDVSRGNG